MRFLFMFIRIAIEDFLKQPNSQQNKRVSQVYTAGQSAYICSIEQGKTSQMTSFKNHYIL